MFVDEAEIIVRGGRGGDGCVSFRKEKYVPRGGPDGGNGGDGGSVILRVDPQILTLLDIRRQRIYAAENGSPGRGKLRHGRNGLDVIIGIPPGTLVIDCATDRLLRDLKRPDEQVVVARGGRGGRGNKTFATSTNRAPRERQEGEPAEERRLKLELKLIADVGIVGRPNAGKSTLLSRLSRAHPKIAAYPFTTLQPHLGIMETADYRRIVLADIPGLIEGAHQGAGLGDEFLRHIERTRMLLHVVDAGSPGPPEPGEAYREVREELRLYSRALAEKPEIVVANKLDLPGAQERIELLHDATEGRFLAISAKTGENVDELTDLLLEEIDKCSSAQTWEITR